MGPGVSSRTPEESLAIFGASGFIWCEALSPGVPKPPDALRDNLWSEVSFLRRFVIFGPVAEAASRNRVPNLSAKVPGKVFEPSLATGTHRNRWDF